MSHHLEAIIQWMLRPGFYAHPVDSVSLQQTHISLVFLAGPRVYKIKKPNSKPVFSPLTKFPLPKKSSSTPARHCWKISSASSRMRPGRLRRPERMTTYGIGHCQRPLPDPHCCKSIERDVNKLDDTDPIA